ncbi:hypothetical protein [Caloranaerobacter azorensis]|uniref:Uncharacterized protein n=1 Tax=Caloranaerobacter azorensis TaxID=116090 RepID=A0A6P1Y9Q9_9FIRM|nr:hypothetical protein [Caloranaerobacter azorensis]QIB26079.1 hypothetical protein G3A45_01390 [Caloranaerobacter azorensis]
MNRQQRRRVHKLTGEELEQIKDQAKKEAIGFTVTAFEKVMRKDFGFGDKRLGRIAAGLYRELDISPEEVEKL